MDDAETQDSASLLPAKAGNGSSSLPKMHSLVQCGTEKYWEVESSKGNWLCFIKSSGGALFESQTSDENEQESNYLSKEWIFPSIASTEPRPVASDGSSRKEMIIHLEVCFVTGIGHLLAVRATEDSYGALFTVEKGLPSRSRTLLPRQKLHLMRPGDKLCYVENGEELLLEYRCETVIETSDTQNILARESFSNVDQTQESDIPMTQQEVPKGEDAMYLTQELEESQCPYSQTSAIRESGGLTKVDSQLKQHSQSQKQQNGNLEVMDDEVLSQASSSSDITIDPTECKTDQLPTNDSSANNQVLKPPPESLPNRQVPVDAEIEESPGLLAPTQPSDLLLAVTKEAMSPQLLARESPTEKQSERQRRPSPGSDHASPGLLAPPTQPSDLQLAATKEPMSPQLLDRDSPPEKQSERQRRRKRALEPLSGSDHASPGLLAPPTQPSDLQLAATKEPMSPQLSDRDSPPEKQSERKRRRKRALEPSPGLGHVGKEIMTPEQGEVKTVRVTRSKTGTPRKGGNKDAIPRILITGYEVDSIIEELVRKIGGTTIQDLAEANIATHVVAKDLKRTIKLMIGLCCTNKIVTLDWLRASAESERPLPCDNFLVIEKKLFDTINKNLQRGKVLEKFVVYFCECVTIPPPNERRLLVEAAGGTIVTDLSMLRGKSKKQVLIIRKGRNFNKEEKARCTACVNDGAITWTLEEFLTAMVTQSRP